MGTAGLGSRGGDEVLGWIILVAIGLTWGFWLQRSIAMTDVPQIPSLPEYLANINDAEERTRTSSLRKLNSSTELKAHAEAIHWAQVILGEFCSTDPQGNEPRAIISFLGLRMFNSIASSFRLATHGYHQTAWAVLRDVIEVANLVNYFHLDPSQILIWQNSTEKDRMNNFKPSKVRRMLSELSFHQHEASSPADLKAQLDKWYDAYCHMASHPNPHAKELIFSDGALQFGPIEDDVLLIRTVFEIAKWGQYGALEIIGHLGSVVTEPRLQLNRKGFFKNYKGWITNFTKPDVESKT